MVMGDEISFGEFKDKLGVMDETPDYLPTFADDMTKALMGNRQHRFQIILDKNVNGTGCLQLARAITDQKILDEPRWRATLSIAKFCMDADTAIHDVSRDHPDYHPRKLPV